MLKITQLLDWQAIEHTLASKKAAYLRDNGGRPAYPLLPMFRAILLGQWHSLSDPELERSPVTRLDFMIFCQFPDEMNLPDHSTLNRFRNRLMQDGFAALAEFDENGDGKIDAQDAVFEQLKVWRDLNQDGISQEGELFTLAELGIAGLNLAHLETNNRQGKGNTIARTGSYSQGIKKQLH